MPGMFSTLKKSALKRSVEPLVDAHPLEQRRVQVPGPRPGHELVAPRVQVRDRRSMRCSVPSFSVTHTLLLS